MTNTKHELEKLLLELKVIPSKTQALYSQLTSLELVELIIKIEKTFKIEISPLDYDVKIFENLASISAFVDSKKIFPR